MSEYIVIGTIIAAFAVAAVLSYFFTPPVKNFAHKVGAIDVPKDARRMHKKPIPRLGGLAIYGGFLCSILIFGQLDETMLCVLLGAAIIVALGIFDDVLALGAKLKFVVQIVAAAIPVCIGDLQIGLFTNLNPLSDTPFVHLGILAVPVTIIWIVGITNAVNLIDGLDGLAVGVSSIAAITMLAVALLTGNMPIAITMAALAGVLMVTAWRMNEWHAIKYMFSHRFKGAMAKFIVTMICTIVFDLTVAIVVGVGLGLILMVARLSKLQINYERVDMSRIKNNDEALNERYRNAMVAYITGPLIFANIDTIEQLTERVGTCDTLLLSMRGVPYIDISAAQALMDILRSLHENGVDIVLCGLPSSAMNMMHRSGIYDMVGEQGFYWSVERALLDLRPYTGKK